MTEYGGKQQGMGGASSRVWDRGSERVFGGRGGSGRVWVGQAQGKGGVAGASGRNLPHIM